MSPKPTAAGTAAQEQLHQEDRLPDPWEAHRAALRAAEDDCYACSGSDDLKWADLDKHTCGL